MPLFSTTHKQCDFQEHNHINVCLKTQSPCNKHYQQQIQQVWQSSMHANVNCKHKTQKTKNQKTKIIKH